MRKTLCLFTVLMMFVLVACGEPASVAVEQPASVAVEQPAPPQADGNITTLTVSGMTCARCVNAINSELSAMDGVNSVSIDFRSGVLVVEHEPTISADEIKEVVILEGFGIE